MGKVGATRRHVVNKALQAAGLAKSQAEADKIRKRWPEHVATDKALKAFLSNKNVLGKANIALCGKASLPGKSVSKAVVNKALRDAGLVKSQADGDVVRRYWHNYLRTDKDLEKFIAGEKVQDMVHQALGVQPEPVCETQVNPVPQPVMSDPEGYEEVCFSIDFRVIPISADLTVDVIAALIMDKLRQSNLVEAQMIGLHV